MVYLLPATVLTQGRALCGSIQWDRMLMNSVGHTGTPRPGSKFYTQLPAVHVLLSLVKE